MPGLDFEGDLKAAIAGSEIQTKEMPTNLLFCWEVS